MRRLMQFFRPPPLRTPDELGAFLCGQANYLTQRATYEFCRNTLAHFGQHTFADPRFQAQERICRWEGFAAVFADGLVIAEGLLRPVAPPPLSPLRRGLVALYAQGLAMQPPPPHRTTDFTDLVEDLSHRLDRAAEAEPRRARDIAHASARRIYDVLPVYSSNQRADREGIDRAMIFGLISVRDQLQKRIDGDALARAIAARS